MSKGFGGGSNYPPGCTGADIDRAFGGPDPSPEEDEILSILEIAHVDADVCDQVMKCVAKLCDRINRLENDR
jgi:hypothetical protein